MNFQFENIPSFISMGGHGVYVWACYIITFIVLTLLVLAPFWQKKHLLKQLKHQQRMSHASTKYTHK